jgi:hypothetical protein
MRLAILIILAVVVLVPGDGEACTQLGQDIAAPLNIAIQNYSGSFDQIFACGFVMGIYDTTTGVLFTSPTGINGNTIWAVVNKWLQNNPETWTSCAVDLIKIALVDAYGTEEEIAAIKWLRDAVGVKD